MNLDDGAVYFANLESQKNIFLEQSLESFISKVITEDEARDFNSRFLASIARYEFAEGRETITALRSR